MTPLFAFADYILIAVASPSLGQSRDAAMPEYAHAKSYCDGWECDRSYRREGDACLAVVAPKNADATNRTYGAGWECLHGFHEVEGPSCVKVVVPEGGYLDPSGRSWSCLRGYVDIDDLCLEIVLPAKAYLANNSFGSLWLCDRGYEVDGQTCAAIAVPENAFLNGSGFGQPWTCVRGNMERGDTCQAVAVPEDAYFYDASYGPGWRGSRGFAASDDGCKLIDIPANAHLDRSGNRWECHRSFQRSQGPCVLND